MRDLFNEKRAALAVARRLGDTRAERRAEVALRRLAERCRCAVCGERSALSLVGAGVAHRFGPMASHDFKPMSADADTRTGYEETCPDGSASAVSGNPCRCDNCTQARLNAEGFNRE